MIPPVQHPVWGVDPSTRRIAVGIVLPGQAFVSRTLELGPGTVDAPKLARARTALVGWFEGLAAEFDPAWLWVEEPFGVDKGAGKGKGRRAGVHPSAQYMLAIVMESAYTATGAVANLIEPRQWKQGAGLHAYARKAHILRWAQGLGLDASCDACRDDGGCDGSPAHDAADALGVAVAGAVFVSARVSAA